MLVGGGSSAGARLASVSRPADRPRRVLYRDAALADGRSTQLQHGISILVAADRIAWTRPGDAGEELEAAAGAEIVDAGGTTIVPGMVDGHSHLTLPGGSHWIDRIEDPPAVALATAARNAALLTQAGVRWARDVGAATDVDPVDGRRRALSLGVRDRSRGRDGWPHIRAAGSWIGGPGSLGAGGVEVADADELVAAGLAQIDDGADLIKLYLDGADPSTCPWSPDEIAR